MLLLGVDRQMDGQINGYSADRQIDGKIKWLLLGRIDRWMDK